MEAGRASLTVYYVPAAGFASPGVEDGEPAGVTADIMRAFADWLGREHGLDASLRFLREDDWQRFYSTVRDSDSGTFGIGNVTITKARRAEVDFSPPYMPNTAVLISSDAYPELKSWEDLPIVFAGMTALAFSGTLHESRLRDLVSLHHPEAHIEPASSNDEILQRVEEGQHFAYVDGYNVWRAQAEGAAIRHHPIGDERGEQFGMIMPRDSDWTPVIGRFLNDYYGSEAHLALFEHHLGERMAALILAPSNY